MQDGVFSYRIFSLFAVFIFCSFIASTQEICDNGKDDDGDGLIDLNDPDCLCHWQTNSNRLVNSSFEFYNHCLQSPFLIDNFDMVTNWIFGIADPGGGPMFYCNKNCPEYTNPILTNHPGLSIQDGQGCIMLGEQGLPGVQEKDNIKYYISQCLQTPLQKGKRYTITFYTGMFGNFAYSYTIGLFGHTDCNAAPFGQAGSHSGCPLNFNGWMLLGSSQRINTVGAWLPVKIDFVPLADINVLEIGGDCEALANSITFFVDNFQLAETKDFNFQHVQILNGNPCEGNYILKAPTSKNAIYQWYKDSIALVGATDSLLHIPEPSTTAFYNVRITKGSDCQISEPMEIKRSPLSLIYFPNDTTICKDTILQIGQNLHAVIYVWNGNKDSIVRISQSGNYSITAIDSFGCSKNFTVTASFKDCMSCSVLVPNAFTPNGDGNNDVLRGHCNCPVAQYDLQVYNRWGEKVFESNSLSNGWNGNNKNGKAPTGVYVYFVKYKNSSTEKSFKTTRGTVLLVR